jgi:putative FmdB family regulatory protein
MPIYEYRCQSCGHQLEKLQRMTDPVLTECPHCGKAQLKRLISAAAFRLKGAGWYETDFKQANQRNLAEASSGKVDSDASSGSVADGAAGAAKPGSGQGKELGKESGKASGSEAGASAGSSKTESGIKGKSADKSDNTNASKSTPKSKPGDSSSAKTA